MSRKLTFGLVGLVALIAAGGAFWYFVIRDDSPPPVSLDSALDSLNTPTASATNPPSAGETPAATVTAEPGGTNVSGLEGSWELDSSANNFVGYRVQEELAQIGSTTAVGRTSNVTGSMVVANGQVEPGATFVADMTSLRSDSSLRDSQLRNQGIQFGRFPTSTFTLTQPIEIPSGFSEGERLSTTLTGTFELHGVTKPVEIPVEAQLANGVIVVVGSILIEFADYEITAPSAARVLSIEDRGIMEFQLFFRPS
ncbi:MAG TPA: YceI family protein [Tepidiformaceae bacterium]|nr:YceI family protein [Tepidiformaceae bacterium]